MLLSSLDFISLTHLTPGPIVRFVIHLSMDCSMSDYHLIIVCCLFCISFNVEVFNIEFFRFIIYSSVISLSSENVDRFGKRKMLILSKMNRKK